MSPCALTSVVSSMKVVESLEDALSVSERRDDHQDVENLMACSNKIEFPPVPSLRDLH